MNMCIHHLFYNLIFRKTKYAKCHVLQLLPLPFIIIFLWEYNPVQNIVFF